MTISSLEQPTARGGWVLAVLASVIAVGAEAADRYWPPIVDPPTGQHIPGRFVWADLVTADVAAAAKFYGAVFGWTFETYGGDDDLDTYTLAFAGGMPIGGMVFDKRAMQYETPSARWIGLISVTDVQGSAAAVAAAGGKVVYAPVELGERGATAIFQDPEGTLFGVVNSKHGDPVDHAGATNEWYWTDLWTADVDTAAQFYRKVVGYEIVPLAVDGPRSGVHLVSGGFARAGIMQKHSQETSSTWLPYIRVADVDAAAQKAAAAGGKVLMKPTALEHAILGIVADPTGAPVGIVQISPSETKQ